MFYPVFHDKATKYGHYVPVVMGHVKGKTMISNTKEVQSEIVL
jgi:hypothetical protein